MAKLEVPAPLRLRKYVVEGDQLVITLTRRPDIQDDGRIGRAVGAVIHALAEEEQDERAWRAVMWERYEGGPPQNLTYPGRYLWSANTSAEIAALAMRQE